MDLAAPNWGSFLTLLWQSKGKPPLAQYFLATHFYPFTSVFFPIISWAWLNQF
jgi:hypothetical protein